jgi:hypothetical protein
MVAAPVQLRTTGRLSFCSFPTPQRTRDTATRRRFGAVTGEGVRGGENYQNNALPKITIPDLCFCKNSCQNICFVFSLPFFYFLFYFT